MKLLFISGTLGSGGKERRLTELIKSLKLINDVEFELVVMSNDIHYKEVLDIGINIHFIIRKTKKDISIFYKFYKLCRSYRPDIVHCWDSMTAVYLVPACKLLHIRLVNGMVINAPLKRNILNKHWLRARLSFPFSDVIVGNSKAGLRAYKAPEEKSIVIHNGFNFNRIKHLTDSTNLKRNLAGSNCLVGMVAAFNDHKDYKTYFMAAQSLLRNRRDITFLAIGNGTDSTEAQSLIDTKYIDHFRLLGVRSDVESFINAMDICVLSTFTEGISNSILEYMALGKPVIATDGGGTCEIVLDNKTGFLINPSNPEELAEKLEILINDRQLRKTMGLAGRERVMNEFSIDQMVSKYTDLYKSLEMPR
jgi:glycosyltransferase involved in cell wall biosynthesis